MYYLSIVQQDKIIKFWAFENLEVAEKMYSEVKNITSGENLYTYNEDEVILNQRDLSCYHVYSWSPVTGGTFFIAHSYKEMRQLISLSYYARIFKGKDALHSGI